MHLANIATTVLTAAEKEQVRCDLLERVDTPIWFYDFDRYAIVWANRPALKIWSAEDSKELAARDLRTGMSKAVAERLQQIKEDLERDPRQNYEEVWTLYPQSGPIAVECTFHEGRFASGRNCTMITVYCFRSCVMLAT